MFFWIFDHLPSHPHISYSYNPLLPAYLCVNVIIDTYIVQYSYSLYSLKIIRPETESLSTSLTRLEPRVRINTFWRFTLPFSSENEASAYSSDDSLYLGADELGENIYEEISEPSSGVTNTVEEIIAVEEYYIDRLNFVIDNYLQPSRPVMGDPFMKAVFGNIAEIKEFHEDIFYPELRQCNKDLIRILECFSSHIAVRQYL